MTKINSRAVVLIVIAALTLIHWLVLIFHVPIFGENSGWFWLYFTKPFGSILTITSVILLAISTTISALNSNNYQKSKIILLIFLGIGLQISFAFTEGRGMDAVRDRLIYTGHAEFAKVAVVQDDTFFVLSHYEELLSEGELGVFPNSKSPGTLLFYSLTKKIAELFLAENEIKNKALVLEDMRLVASYLWPFISYLVLIPIILLSKVILGNAPSLLACALYITIPSVNLMTLHTDQVIYPLLFMMPILIAAIAAQKNNILIMFFAGAMVFLAMWFSFSLIFSVIFVFWVSFILSLQRQNFTFQGFTKLFSGCIAGFIAIHLLFEAIFNYNFLTMYAHATKFHFGFKGWEGGLQRTLYYALLNTIEFFVWIGLPMVMLMILGFYVSAKDVFVNGKIKLEHTLAILVPLTIILIALVGKTKAETARLWMFMIPCICIVVAHIFIQKFGDKAKVPIALLITCQLGTTYLIKTNQDFF